MFLTELPPKFIDLVTDARPEWLMIIRSGLLVVLLSMLSGTSCVLAADSYLNRSVTTMALWRSDVSTGTALVGEEKLPDRGGDVIRITNVNHPGILVYPVANATRPTPAVLVCPGGGYKILAINIEGTEVAEWLNSIGITAVVLKYRVPDNRPAAFQDAQRAMRLIRHQALEWNINPNQVGILGFSAGAHLAAQLSTKSDTESYAPFWTLQTN